MSDIRNIPRGTLAGYIADILRGGKDILNAPGKLPQGVPLLGGQGAGDLLLGHGPELVNDWSYGFGHGTGSGMTTKPDSRIADLAFTPGLASAPALLRRGGESAVKTVATDMGRREFMKKGAALAGGAALAAASPKLLTKLLREAPVTATAAAEHVAPAVAASAVRSWTPEVLEAAIAKMAHFHFGRDTFVDVKDPEVVAEFKKLHPTPDTHSNWKGFVDQWQNPPSTPEATRLVGEPKLKAEREAHPNYEQMHPTYGIPPQEYYAMEAKHLPKSAEQIQWDNAQEHLHTYSHKQLDDIINAGVDKFPKELSNLGITPSQVSYARYPVQFGPFNYAPELPEDKFIKAMSKTVDQ